jgi:hypothetical protein
MAYNPDDLRRGTSPGPSAGQNNLYYVEDSYGGGSATDEGILDYTPSGEKSEKKHHGLPLMQPDSNSGF